MGPFELPELRWTDASTQSADDDSTSVPCLSRRLCQDTVVLVSSHAAMKLWVPAFAAALTVSAACASSAQSPLYSSGHIIPTSSTPSPSKTAWNQANSLSRIAGQDSCRGLPRNTVLSSCPAPCLPDAPCIVYDQDAEQTQLTGCDFNTSSSESFCTSTPTQMCEFHCFPGSIFEGSFGFHVLPISSSLGLPRPRTVQDPSRSATIYDTTPYQSADFVASIGKLNLSENIREVAIIAGYRNDKQLVDVDVDPAILVSAPSVTTLTIENLPLSSDRVAAIVASASSNLIGLQLTRTNLTSLTGEFAASLPALENLFLIENPISVISWSDVTFPSLTSIGVTSKKLTEFGLRAPMLQQLYLSSGMLVRIPESVFTYTHLTTLDLFNNPIVRPLVLTALQVQFLEALPDVLIQLVDPPHATIVSRLPVGEKSMYGDYSDDMDLSLLLVGASETVLRGDPMLPALVVKSEEAKAYNDLLEVRARHLSERGSSPSQPTRKNATNSDRIPIDICPGVPRNTLLSYCAEGYCPRNGACVAFEPSTSLSQSSSGCDYEVASNSSFCTRANGTAKTCEFQCFAAYHPQSQFKFFIPLMSEVDEEITRRPDTGDLVELETTEIPFLSNRFVDKIGPLNFTSTVTEVWIAGGQSDTGTPGLMADVIVSPKLLSKAPSVTSLSLTNIDIGKSDLSTILMSAPRELKSLNLRNTNLATIPTTEFASLEQLETLTLAQNILSNLDIRAVTLAKLDLSENALTTLGIEAPNLEMLDLSRNNLVRIPLSVFSLSRLKTLNLEDNLLAFPLVLSSIQAAFLDSVAVLQLSQRSRADSLRLSQDEDRVVLERRELPVNGTAVIVKGIAVIIVSEQIANDFNDGLEQMQKELTHGSTTASPGISLNSTGPAVERSPFPGTSSTGESQDNGVSGSNETAGSASRAGGSDLSSRRGDSPTPESKEDTVTAIAATSVSVTTTLMLGGLVSSFFVAVVYLFADRKRRRTEFSKVSSYEAMTDSDSASTSLPVDSSLHPGVSWWRDDDMLSHRLNAGDISDVRAIDSGTWLINYRGRSRQLVAKRLVQSERVAHETKVVQLFAEAKIASWLCFPSIVPFVGVAWTDKSDLQVLHEYMPNGDLGSYLARTNAPTLPWMPDKLQLAIDIIEALVYTHSFNPPLLHRDLKSSNVLLDDDFKAKLGGFSCARLESDSNTMTSSEIGTARWLAPEILLGSTSYGTSSDIYSFGIVLCELDTHQVPYAVEATVLGEVRLLQHVARGELRPSVSGSCLPEIREIADACLAFHPDERPNAMQVAYLLRSLRRQEMKHHR